MFFEILVFVFIGIAFGVFTGLIPGIHVNTVYMTIPMFSAFFIAFNIPTHAIAAFVISTAITSTILDFIPSIFLGAPEDATALSVLPGHQLLLQGKGFEALFLTTCGGVFVTILFVAFTPLLLFVLPFIYNSIKFYMPFVLLALSSFMILTERRREKIFLSSLLFLLSGILGLLTLNTGILPDSFLFFPLFTGLFGISTLLLSLGHKGNIPPQDDLIVNIDKKLIVSGVVKSFFSSILVGLLPGVGATQATVLTQELTRKRDSREFLVSVGGVNTVVALISFIALYTIQKARSGAAVAVRNLVENFGMNELLLLISVSLISVGIAAILAMYIGSKLLKFIQKISYSKISIFILSFLVVFCFFSTGIIGIFILCIATSIGMIAPLSGIKRSHAMGVLIVPVTLFYLGIRLL